MVLVQRHVGTHAYTHTHARACTLALSLSLLLTVVTTHLPLICFWELSWAKGCSLLQSGKVGSSLRCSFPVMESDGMGPAASICGPVKTGRIFCPETAPLSVCLSCRAGWEPVKEISARPSAWLSGETRRWWHIALMGSPTAPNPPSTQMTSGARCAHQSWLQSCLDFNILSSWPSALTLTNDLKQGLASFFFFRLQLLSLGKERLLWGSWRLFLCMCSFVTNMHGLCSDGTVLTSLFFSNYNARYLRMHRSSYFFSGSSWSHKLHFKMEKEEEEKTTTILLSFVGS